MICPECHSEYVAGATECRDCLVPLVDAPPVGTAQSRAPRSALAGSNRALAVCALAVGAIVVASLLLSIAVRVGIISDDTYDSSLVHLAGVVPFMLFGPLLAWTALAARQVAPSARGRGLLAATAVVGLVGAAFFLTGRLFEAALSPQARMDWWNWWNATGFAGYLIVGIAMSMLAVGLLRAGLVPVRLALLLLGSVVLMAFSNLARYALGSVLVDVAWGAQGAFWIALGVFCLPRRGVSAGRSGFTSAQLTRRSSRLAEAPPKDEA